MTYEWNLYGPYPDSFSGYTVLSSNVVDAEDMEACLNHLRETVKPAEGQILAVYDYSHRRFMSYPQNNSLCSRYYRNGWEQRV